MSETPESPPRIPPWWTDPTENVKKLVDAAMQRQDDLRAMESKHVRELMALRSSYDEKLRNAESNRIDAIRAVDVGAVNRAAEVATTQAQALATQLIATAEASRVQVQAAATAAVTSLAAALEPIQKDIRDLRDAQSRGLGVREQVVETRETTTQSRSSVGLVIGIIGGAVGFLSLILAFYLATKK